MTKFKIFMAGGAGLALTLAAATPAAAQYYPQPSNGGIVGAIVNSVIGGGYGQYPMGNYGYGQVDQRGLVEQCAIAVDQRLNGQYRGQGYGAYNGYGQQRYGYANQGGARVLGITNVERRSNGGLRIHGVATSGGYAQQGYYGRQRYGQAQADLAFNCKVGKRGQINDVTISRNDGRYNQGYRGY